MKFLFSGLIISMFSINLHAEGLSLACQKEIDKLCPKEKTECMKDKKDKLSPECQNPKIAPNPCADIVLDNKCKGKQGAELMKCLESKGMDDEILKTMQKKGSKECQKYLGQAQKSAECPLPPSPVYKDRADQANEDYNNYFDKLSPECKAKAKLQNP